MKNADLSQLTRLLVGVWAAREKSLSEPLLELFALALSPYEITAIRTALIGYIRNPDNGQFLPTPADVIRHLDGNSSSQALKAWTKVTQAIKSVGGYSSIIFDDALIHSVIYDMGGWIALCRTNNDELVFRGKEFEKRYGGYLLKKPANYPKCLIGTFEHYNTCKGLITEPARLWGDETLAILIYEQGSNLSHFSNLAVNSVKTILLNDPPLKGSASAELLFSQFNQINQQEILK